MAFKSYALYIREDYMVATCKIILIECYKCNIFSCIYGNAIENTMGHMQ